MRGDIETYRRVDGRWANRIQGSYRTQEEAVRGGCFTAMQLEVEHFVRGLSGRLLRRNSYGHDPRPPRGSRG